MRRGALAALVVALGLTLSACAPAVPAHEDGSGAARSERAADLRVAGVEPRALPAGAELIGGIRGDSAPVAVADVFLLGVLPDAEDPRQRVIAVDETGSRWQVHTSPSCVGWAVSSTAEGEPRVAVLDAVTRRDGAGFRTDYVASGFRADGTPAWDATPVLGPRLGAGPGMRFGEVPGSIVSDAPINAQALNPADGTALTVAAAEQARIVFEGGGIAVLREADRFVARDLAGGGERWARPANEGDSLPEQPAAGGVLALQLLGTEGPRAQLIDAGTGDAIGAPVPGRILGVTGSSDGTRAVLAVGGAAGTRIVAAEAGSVRWNAELPGEAAELASVGPDWVALRVSGEGLLLRADSGAPGSRGDFPVPIAQSTQNVGAVPSGEPGEYALVRMPPLGTG
ncbi:hypothetical protein [Leucobacter sp. M11]|uniref:hypothetical protein n=1 Tax=Leucobacter sp. M11 TaxID=2993565 RepID=UPI002D7E7A47|nr:hypothetical protein [Leucobacter sp. M11]MEB4615278.1 hypothetical protein [Leucobacter sp. M11]